MPQKHLKPQQVLDYLEGKHSPLAHASVQAHLAQGCESCNELSRWWQAALQDLAVVGTSTVSAPSNVIARAVDIFTTSSRVQASSPRSLFTAALVFDSLRRPALAGVRGVTTSIQQVYRAEDHFIELGMERQAAGNWALIGVMIPPDNEPLHGINRVALVGHNGASPVVDWSNMEFYATGLTPGDYDLHLDFDSCTVNVPDVHVGDTL